MVFQIEVHETGARFEVQSGESLLDGALRAGVRIPHDCTLGGCGTCRIRVLEGRVGYDELPMALAPEEAEAGFALACQARPHTDLVIANADTSTEMPDPVRVIAEVASVRDLGDEVTHLRLTIPGDTPPRFRPGQYVNVIMEDGTRRSFSMASATSSATLDFHVRRIAGGRFTDGIVSNLQAGQQLDIEFPLGGFRYHHEDYRPIVMVATGTGLAPLKAMLESLMDDPDCPPVSLYWGARTQRDLYLHAEIPAWGERLYEFRYVPVLSRADTDWDGRRGYVQDAVCTDFPDLSECSIYLCGSPDMINSAKHAFIGRGASIEHLYADGFTFQHMAD